MYFCDTIEKCQKSLKANDNVPLKSELTKQNNIVTQKTIFKHESEFIVNDADLLEHLFGDENDEDLDSPASDDEIESKTSASGSTCIILRNKMPPPIQPCSVFLERLEISFIKSDTESESETEDEEDPLKCEKRPRASGSAERTARNGLRNGLALDADHAYQGLTQSG